MCCQVARSCSGPQGQPLKGCREQRPTTSSTHCCYLVLTDQTHLEPVGCTCAGQPSWGQNPQNQEPHVRALLASHPSATRNSSSLPGPACCFLACEPFDPTGEEGFSSRLEELSSESLSLSLETTAGKIGGEERRETVIHNVHNTCKEGARWIQIKHAQMLTR